MTLVFFCSNQPRFPKKMIYVKYNTINTHKKKEGKKKKKRVRTTTEGLVIDRHGKTVSISHSFHTSLSNFLYKFVKFCLVGDCLKSDFSVHSDILTMTVLVFV